MKVMIIPEDFRKDQYMLKPLVKSLFVYLGASNTKITVCQDPLIGGIVQATKWDCIQDVLLMYPMIDLFLLLVDRDGEPNRHQALTKLEQQASAIGKLLIAEHAWQEIEVWVLAGLPLPNAWSWSNIRTERDPKEVYFSPYAKDRGVASTMGGGRKVLGKEAAANYKRIRSLCSEDIQRLETNINIQCERSLRDW